MVLAASLDFCVCLGVFSGEYQYLEEQTAVPLWNAPQEGVRAPF